MWLLNLTDRKSNYLVHLNRAIQCKIKLEKPKLKDIVYITYNSLTNNEKETELLKTNISEDLICTYCNKELSNKYHLKQHLLNCKKKKDKEIELLTIENIKLKDNVDILKELLKKNNFIIKKNKKPKKKKKIEVCNGIYIEKETTEYKIGYFKKKIKNLNDLVKYKNSLIKDLELQNKFLNIQNNKIIKEIVNKNVESSIIILDENDVFELKFQGFNNEVFIVYERKIDGWIDGISLCKAVNKDFNEWFSKPSTKTELISINKDLSKYLIIENKKFYESPTNLKIEDFNNLIEKDSGYIFLHPKVAIHFSCSISSTFTLKLIDKMHHIMENGHYINKNNNEEENKRPTISKTLRNNIWYRYIGKDKAYGKCYVCKDIIHMNEWHCSHIIAHSKGGPIHIDNLVPCCSSCNQSMKNKNLEEFKLEYFSKIEKENIIKT